MVQASKETGLTTKLMGSEITYGLMVASSKVIGKTTICMVREFTYGQMAGSMKEVMLMIRRMALEFTIGLMVDNFLVNGKMESSMVKAHIQVRMETHAKEYGSMASGLNGQTEINYLDNTTNLHI